LEHALIEFKDSGGGGDDLRVRVCYRYTFNMKKNLKPGSKLPCGLEWDEVDVVLGLFNAPAITSMFLPRTGAPKDFAARFPRLTVISVTDIYEALLEMQLRDAHRACGKTPPEHSDLLAMPKECNVKDVHYALPGVTDHAVRVWFSLIASGVFPVNGARPGGVSRASDAARVIGRGAALRR
jgi:hypothetical protein